MSETNEKLAGPLTEDTPNAIEFGGLQWRLINREDGTVEYKTNQPGIGECYISQYSDGRWYANNSMHEVLTGLMLSALGKDVTRITNTREEAMTFCVDARALVEKDLKKILLALAISDPYGVGFRDGQADIKAKISEAMQ